MRVVETFPRSIREIENVWIELSDGCRLAARIWLPEDAETDVDHLLYLNATGLTEEPGEETPLSYRSPEDTGECAGEYCAIWLGPELPADQRLDDGRSLVFDGPPLEQELDILGAPRVVLKLVVNRPQAHVAVRLNAVNPDGSVERVSYGVLNLGHRHDAEQPRPLTPGEVEEIVVTLDHCAQRFRAGQRLRVAVSNSYWPLIWPDPEPVTLTLHTGASRLELPVRREAGQPTPAFPEPETAPPLALRETRPAAHLRRLSHDHASGLSRAEFVDDFGAAEDPGIGLTRGSVAREYYRIDPGDPTTARMDTHWTQTLSRGDWSIRTEARASLRCDAEWFHLAARVEAYEGDTLVHEKRWERTLPREQL